MKLFLQPNDAFFFRDGRPFTKGEQAEGHSIFPPLPSTVLGALRSTYITEFGDLSLFCSNGMKDMIGTSESLCDAIRLRGVFLASNQDNQLNMYFPVPLDLVYKKAEERTRHIPLHALTRAPKNFISNDTSDTILAWSDSEGIDSEADGLLDMVDIERYLLKDPTDLQLIGLTTLIEREPKIGIARSRDTLSSEDRMLYRMNMSRFKNSDGNYGFVTDYECSQSLPKAEGLLKLGGEGKSFTYQDIDLDLDSLSSHLETVRISAKSTGTFKLYFATPTIFKNGWLPSWLASDTLSGEYPLDGKCSISLRLITAAVGKPITIGGWNMAKREAKPTYRAVPAGSVYYFELIDRSRIDDLIAAFHYQNISDRHSDEGFGLAFIGVADGGNP